MFGSLLRYQLHKIFKIPYALVISVVDRCSLRCSMCDIWQHEGKDLSLEEWNKSLDLMLLSRVRYIGLTGGEPLLYKPLPEFIALLCKKFDLETLHLNTSGLYPDRLETVLKVMQNIKGTRFVIAISIDGTSSHDQIRGIPGAFEKAVASVKLTKKYGTPVTINSVIWKQTPNELRSLQALTKELDVPWNVTPAYTREDLDNEEKDFRLGETTKDFLRELLLKNFKQKSNRDKMGLVDLGHLKQLETGKRSMPCAFLEGTALYMNAKGQLNVCQNEPDNCGDFAERRNDLKETRCKTCLSTCLNSLAYRGHPVKLASYVLGLSSKSNVPVLNK